jgi:long-chain acyl-CoA synthetase
MSKNLAVLLEQGAVNFPGHPGIIFEGKKITYGELEKKAGQIGQALKTMGVAKGDRVAIHLPNIPEFIMAYFGILKAGATVVPINVMLKKDEIRYVLSNSGARNLFTLKDFLPEVISAVKEIPGFQKMILLGGAGDGEGVPFARMVDPSNPALNAGEVIPEEDLAVIFYTSGTTGKPKGAMLTHGNMYSNALATAETYKYCHDDIILSAMPMFHAAGQTNVMTAAFSQGATVVLLPRFSPEKVFEALAQEKATVYIGVPTMYFQILYHSQSDKFAQNNLRLCLVGAASMPEKILKEFGEKFKVPISEGYGLSEAAPVVSHNPIDGIKKPLSIGVPIPGVEMKIFGEDDLELGTGEIGELVIRGPNVMKGYLNRPEETAEALRGGWLHTGDMAYRDEDGYFFIVDRKKEMILTGGFNIYPREVEEVMFTHPKIAEVAVVGIPDLEKGEKAKAFVVLKQGETATQEEVLEFCRSRMAVYKAPREAEFMNALPRNASGKVLKRILRGEKE